MTGEGEAKAGLSAGKRAAEETFGLVAEYFAPIGGFAVGFFAAGPKLGGAWTLGDLIYNFVTRASSAAANTTTSNAVDVIAGAVFGGIFIGCGYHLWRSGRSMKTLGKAVSGFFGGLLMGWGSHQLAAGLSNSLNYNGWIDSSIRNATGD